jgi:hypothetical protein
MTPNDRANLKFLLNVDAETLKDWYAAVDKDDHEYAMELLTSYSQEIRERSIEFQIEAQLVDSDWRESAEVLSRFVGYMPGEHG